MPDADNSDFAIAAPAWRYLHATVAADLANKMVFIGGSRQVGKTLLARSLLPPDCELDYDIAAHRQAILKHQLPAGDFWFFCQTASVARSQSIRCAKTYRCRTPRWRAGPIFWSRRPGCRWSGGWCCLDSGSGTHRRVSRQVLHVTQAPARSRPIETLGPCQSGK